MIQTTELRIGNWVLFDLEEVYEQITTRKLAFIAQANSKGQSHPFKPIPLSEEILLKCPEITKCTYHEETWRIRDPKSQFHIVKHNDRFVFRGVGMSVIYVDTLHHLQNLVYVNTLKELEVEL